jgi:dephospho-CoA kinase
MQIFGLAGTINAGKDVVGELLAEKYGFLHMSTSDMLREIKRREFGDTPQALLIRNDPFVTNLRNTKGPGFLVDAVHEEWLANKDKYPGGFVASAIRAIGEVERIHYLGGKVIFVDADPKIRYERSQKRQRDANEAGKSFEEFMLIERREIDVDPSDKSVTNMPAMRQMADITIENNGDDIEAFKIQAINILNL